jgi:hypothetical protein
VRKVKLALTTHDTTAVPAAIAALNACAQSALSSFLALQRLNLGVTKLFQDGEGGIIHRVS